MKIYVVLDHLVSDYGAIEKLFKTKHLADEYAKFHNNGRSVKRYYVEEWEVEE